MNALTSSEATGKEARSTPPPATRAVVPPLLHVVLPLVVAAIGLSIVFAKLFPVLPGKRVAPAVRFTNAAEEAGLAAFRHFPGVGETPTTLSGGVTVFDCDADGDMDIFFVNGAPWPWEETMMKRAAGTTCALFRNDGRGNFTDVTARAGLNVELQGVAAAAGDFDADGLVDLFITCVGTNHLFHNRGDGRFEDVTEEAGVGGDDHTWSTGAAWVDVDGDGRLDLIVAHYAHWSAEVGLAAAIAVASHGRSYGAPTGFVSAFPSVYRNLGGGRFALVAGSAGLRDVDAETGLPVEKPIAVVPVDANGDRRLDVLFTYHTSDAALFLSRGDGTYRKSDRVRGERPEGVTAGVPSGFSLPREANERFAIVHAASARNTNLPGGDVYLPAKLALVPADFDFDGKWEAFSPEGRAERDLNRFEGGRDFAAPAKLVWLEGAAWQSTEVAERAGAAEAIVGRGAAMADFDGDGDSDVVVAQHGGTPRLLRNEQRLALPWLRVKLVGDQSPPDGSGARVEVHTPRRVLSQVAAPAMGLLAQSEPVLTFGLGEDARVRAIVVYWPSGRRQEVRPLGINREIAITEE